MLHAVTDVTFDDIINDFGTYADLLLEHKVLGFAAPLYLDIHQHAEILRLLYTHGVCTSYPIQNSVGMWTNNTGVNHHPSTSLKDGDDPLELAKRNYHADTVETKRPESVITMSMHTYSKAVYGNRPGYEELAKWEGLTVYFDMQDLYQKCPHKDYLETLDLQHPPLPGTEVEIHPALRTHPITGKTSLCLSNSNCVPVGCEFNTVPRYDGQERTFNPNTKAYDYFKEGDLPQEFVEYMAWFKGELNKEENRHWWHWEEGHFIIWDNRCTYHSFSGYEFGPTRVFDKGMVGHEGVWYGEKPQEFIDEDARAEPGPEAFGHVAWVPIDVTEWEAGPTNKIHKVDGDRHDYGPRTERDVAIVGAPVEFGDGTKMTHATVQEQVPYKRSPIQETYDD